MRMVGGGGTYSSSPLSLSPQQHCSRPTQQQDRRTEPLCKYALSLAAVQQQQQPEASRKKDSKS